MSSGPSTPQPLSRTPRGAPQKSPRSFPWTSILLVSSLFLGVLAVFEAPREIGRWHLAAAQEHWDEAEYAALQGDGTRAAENRATAFAKLENALKWSKEEPDWLKKRAEWKLDASRSEEALADINALMSKVGEDRERLELRSKIYQHLGRHGDAVKDLETVNNLSKVSGVPPRATALNNLAYAKAVGGLQLDSALKEINEALNSEKHDAFLDTRGFIHYRQGKYDLAMKDLDLAAKGAERILALLGRTATENRRAAPDVRKYELTLRKMGKEPTAVILYHRSLAHEKLGHSAAAAVDRKRVFELIGREGDEKLF